MNILAILCLALMAADSVNSEDELCKNVAIHSADRYYSESDSRFSYRVYRDNYYWELIGLPAKTATVRGPFNVSKDMLPIDKNTKLLTIGSGGIKGYQYKFNRTSRKWWRYTNKGKLHGTDYWSDIPDHGFDAVYNDGDLYDKGYPVTVAFFGPYVNYWKTLGEIWTRVEPWNRGGHKMGKFGEKFPLEEDVSAAMPYEPPKSDPYPYYVYLFKWDKYCLRPYKGVDGCPDGWKKNKELFNCSNKYPDPTKPPKHEEHGIDNRESGPTGGHSSQHEEPVNGFNLMAIVISFMFYYLL